MPQPGRWSKQFRQILWPFALRRAHLQFAVSTYFRVMATARPQDDPYLRRYKVAKDATWLLLLALAYLQYYFMDVYAQIASLPSLTIRV